MKALSPTEESWHATTCSYPCCSMYSSNRMRVPSLIWYSERLMLTVGFCAARILRHIHGDLMNLGCRVLHRLPGNEAQREHTCPYLKSVIILSIPRGATTNFGGGLSKRQPQHAGRLQLLHGGMTDFCPPPGNDV